MSVRPPPGSTVTTTPKGRRLLGRIAPVAIIALGVVAILPAVHAGAAQAPVSLGTAGNFAVLAGSGITNTGATTVFGDVGTFPTPTEVGFGTMTLHGTDHGGDAVTQQAKDDLTNAYNVAAGRGPATAVATELGGRTLTPGVYSGTTLGITGTLTLDTLGDPAAVFVFQTTSTLITASASSVVVLNGGEACSVYWQVASSATLGTSSRLIGSVLAATSITATTGATVQGRLLAQNAAVTLDNATIDDRACAATTPAPTTTTTTAPVGGTTTTVPGVTPTTTAPAGATTTTVPSGVTTTTTVPAGATTTTLPAGVTTTTLPAASGTTTASTATTISGSVSLPTATAAGGTTGKARESGTPAITDVSATTTTTTSAPGLGTAVAGRPPRLPVTGAGTNLALFGGLLIVLGTVVFGAANVAPWSRPAVAE